MAEGQKPSTPRPSFGPTRLRPISVRDLEREILKDNLYQAAIDLDKNGEDSVEVGGYVNGKEVAFKISRVEKRRD